MTGLHEIQPYAPTTGRARWLCPVCGHLVDPYTRRCHNPHPSQAELPVTAQPKEIR